jgi:hypothetical protein
VQEVSADEPKSEQKSVGKKDNTSVSKHGKSQDRPSRLQSG